MSFSLGQVLVRLHWLPVAARITFITNPATVKFTTKVNREQLRSEVAGYMVESPTHRAGHTLDIVFVNVDQSTTVSVLVQPPVIIDHSVIIVKFPLLKLPPVSISVTTRAWKNFDQGAFHKDLEASVLCSSEYAWNSMSIDDLAETSLLRSTTLTSLIDQNAPSIVVQKHYR